jgi:serine/threonine protein kinase
MSNVLKVSLQTTIYSLADRGWSQRRIASELGINRETVRRYLRLAKPYLGDESARLRFLREARAAASVRHPNVARVLRLGRTGQNYFYAMEFVEGETLENLIKRGTFRR